MDFDINLILLPLFFISGGILLWDIGRRTGKVKDLHGFKHALMFWKHRKQQGLDLITKADKKSSEVWWVDYSRSLFPIIAIVVIIRSFLFEPYQILSGSMLPTLEKGDFLLVSKYSYGIRAPLGNYEWVTWENPKRGDIVIFNFPGEPPVRYIKRVIGLPGDTIFYKDKQLTVNGVLVNNEQVGENSQFSEFSERLQGSPEYIIRKYERAPTEGQLERNSWEVPAGHYFVMGDNRDSSFDSRYWGFVPQQNIVGKAWVIWMTWKSWISLPTFNRTGKLH